MWKTYRRRNACNVRQNQSLSIVLRLGDMLESKCALRTRRMCVGHAQLRASRQVLFTK
jgi:hypothetical protein